MVSVPNIPNVLVTVTSAVWIVLEVSLFVRDRVQRRGGTALDQRTRAYIVVTITVAIVLASFLSRPVRGLPALGLPGGGTLLVLWIGLGIIWLGLLVRAWAIAVLGRSFRTTVEVDEGQQVVEAGPYRWVRHPSYTGLLLIGAGFGVAAGTLPSLVVAVLLPLLVLLRRIQIEEEVLASRIGKPYQEYRRRTKRLVPGVW